MRLGILGGTFNPIHLGHLVLAESAREQCALDEVWFIPTATPPHKSSRDLLDGRRRLELIRVAVRGHPSFRASDLELRLGGISYTLRTVRAIRQDHPKAKLFCIVGSDMLTVPWYGLEELCRLCTFVAAKRPMTATARRFPAMRWLSMPYLDISSSMIRARLQRGQSIRYLVPDAVARSISRHRLYQRASSPRRNFASPPEIAKRFRGLSPGHASHVTGRNFLVRKTGSTERKTPSGSSRSFASVALPHKAKHLERSKAPGRE
ncbi:MAG: nicotinate (nicotinamide) nucleotide adenylyltransferase [Candidatus Omnitrophica bacterium]|nr:nicotinate (nicotinamide) nucleotide adenylyltransferase [Candidatus Omnitrophota bacterium]